MKNIYIILILIFSFAFFSCATLDSGDSVVKASGYTSRNLSATSNVFVLNEVTSEFSVGDIVTFGDSKKEHEIVQVNALKKSESGNSQSIILMDGVGFVVKKGWKVSVVYEEARNHQQEVMYLGYRNGKVGYYKEKLEVESQGNTNVAKYEGEMENGVPNGQGTFTFTAGEKWVGEFRENLPWNITIYDKDGTILRKYVNGKVIVE